MRSLSVGYYKSSVTVPLFLLLSILFINSSYALCLVCTCTASAQSLNFGTYTINAVDQVTGTFNVLCTTTVAISATVTVGASTGSSGTFTNRTLTKSGAPNLNYNLYTEATYTNVWTTTNTISMTLAIGLLSATTFPFTIYGQIPASQDVPPGTYTDTVIVTVTY